MRKSLSVVVSIALVMAGLPALFAQDRPELPTEIYVQNGNGIFRLDFGEFLSGASAVLQHREGLAEATLYRAVLAGEAGPSHEGPDFVFDEEPDLDDVVVLGEDERSASRAAGVRFGEIRDWHLVAQLRWTADDRYLYVEFRTDTDTMLARFPWSMLTGSDLDPDATVEDVLVTVNDVSAALNPRTLHEIMASLFESGIVPPHLAEEADSMQEVLEQFLDRAKFVGNYAGLGLILQTVLERLQQMNPHGCFWPCFGCGAALASYGLSIAAIILGCPTLTPACLIGIIGHELAAASVLMACGQCFHCLDW